MLYKVGGKWHYGFYRRSLSLRTQHRSVCEIIELTFDISITCYFNDQNTNPINKSVSLTHTQTINLTPNQQQKAGVYHLYLLKSHLVIWKATVVIVAEECLLCMGILGNLPVCQTILVGISADTDVPFAKGSYYEAG